METILTLLSSLVIFLLGATYAKQKEQDEILDSVAEKKKSDAEVNSTKLDDILAYLSADANNSLQQNNK